MYGLSESPCLIMITTIFVHQITQFTSSPTKLGHGTLYSYMYNIDFGLKEKFCFTLKGANAFRKETSRKGKLPGGTRQPDHQSIKNGMFC